MGFGFRFQILVGSVTVCVTTLIIIIFFVKVLLGRGIFCHWFHLHNHHHYHHHLLFVKVLVSWVVVGRSVCCSEY